MPRLITVQNKFTSGEVSFRIKGRSEIEKYQEGLEIAQNFRVLSQGPIERRNGSFVISRVKEVNDPPRLLRFILSATQSFIMEFGDLYVRFYTQTAQVGDSGAPGTPFELETIYPISEVFELQFTQSEFSLIITHVNHPQQELVFSGSGADDWEIFEFIASPPPTFEPGFFPETTLTAGASTGVGVTFTASGDTFSLSDVGRSIEGVGKIGVASIKTFTNSTNVIADILDDFEPAFSYASGEWLLDLSPLTTITFNNIIRVGGIVTVTATPTANDTFQTSDIGKYILANSGVMQILTIGANGRSCECEILKSLSSDDNTANWTVEVPTWNEERGFPSTVTQAQQRLLFAGSKAQPQTIWPSESGIIDGFGIGADDDDSMELDIVSNDNATIQWMQTARDIVIGTTGGESTINISSKRLTPGDPEITNRSTLRSSKQSAIVVGSEVLFIQKGSRKIIGYGFDFSTDTFKGDDLTFISEQITTSGIRQLVYGQEPNKQIYAVTNDGVMLSGTYDRDQGVIGFTRYTTSGQYLSVMTIPEGEKDQVWVVVRRRVNDNVSVFIEVFDDSSGEDSSNVFSDSAIVASSPMNITLATIDPNAIFVSADHGLIVGDRIKFKQFSQWTGIDEVKFTVDTIIDDDTFTCGFDSRSQPPYLGGARVFKVFTTVGGLNHLEGEIVQIKVDNANHAEQLVVSGSVTLDNEYAEVVVGLPYTSRLLTLPKEFDIGQGSMQTQRKRLVKPTLRVDRSQPPMLNGNIKPNRVPAFLMDNAEPLFTGDLIYPSGKWGTTAQADITTSEPFPLRILGLYGTTEGNTQ